MPDIHNRTRNAPFGDEVGYFAVHEGDLPLVRVLNDAASYFAEGGAGGPKGAKDGRGGGVASRFGHVFVCDFVDEPAYVMRE